MWFNYQEEQHHQSRWLIWTCASFCCIDLVFVNCKLWFVILLQKLVRCICILISYTLLLIYGCFNLLVGKVLSCELQWTLPCKPSPTDISGVAKQPLSIFAKDTLISLSKKKKGTVKAKFLELLLWVFEYWTHCVSHQTPGASQSYSAANIPAPVFPTSLQTFAAAGTENREYSGKLLTVAVVDKLFVTRSIGYNVLVVKYNEIKWMLCNCKVICFLSLLACWYHRRLQYRILVSQHCVKVFGNNFSAFQKVCNTLIYHAIKEAANWSKIRSAGGQWQHYFCQTQ